MKIPALLLLLVSVSVPLMAADGGTLQGKVVDENGEGLASATVTLMRLNPTKVIHREIRTDENGQFLVDRLPWGPVMVSASKEQDGYADTILDLYAANPNPIAVLSPERPSESVTVRMPPRAGAVKVAITDSITGRSIEAPTVTVRRADGSAFLTTQLSEPELLVPSFTKVLIELRAPGYADWYYPGYSEASKANSVLLRPGQKLAITVILQPVQRFSQK